MSDKTGSRTVAEAAAKYGIKMTPADHPIFTGGWQIGSTVPYRQKKALPEEETKVTPSASGKENTSGS